MTAETTVKAEGMEAIGRLLCRPRPAFAQSYERAGLERAAAARRLGFGEVEKIFAYPLFLLRKQPDVATLEKLSQLLCDPVLETLESDAGAALDADEAAMGWRVEVILRFGVTNAVAQEYRRITALLNLDVGEVRTGFVYHVVAPALSPQRLEALTRRLLANPVIHEFHCGRITALPQALDLPPPAPERFDVAAMDDAALLALSQLRRSALDLAEMQAIRHYYQGLKRPASDVELEMIAQTWSEHCVHKTFRAAIAVEGEGHPYPPVVNDLLKTYIKRASDQVMARQEAAGAAPFVLSAFVDNAGIIALDDELALSFKVETHNHPSAIEPFGGANTGVGGVIRDIMGVSARPVAATDVLCFGDPATVGEGGLPTFTIIEGVIAGVADYGNKMGVPTVNGSIHFDPGYHSNPLVYCGCVGIAPRHAHPRAQQVGDAIVALGGRTGRDGIRGATFSSMPLDAQSGEVAGASVQIGDPIVQKQVLEVVLRSRDEGLYSAITDCGAGGFSSAVGEMAAALGCEVELDGVPLKYPNLAPWELWLSEAQERMVLAVPPAHLPRLRALCQEGDVEMTVLGHFTGDGRVTVRHRGEVVASLDCDFLHGALPQRHLRARPGPPELPLPSTRPPPAAWADRLLAVLQHSAVKSREAVVRRYDHEVQGATILRPYEGVRANGPQDAAVLQPREVKGVHGFALGNGFNHRYTRCDPYAATLAIVDEAIRNVVACGADPQRIAILDNFCLGDPNRPEVMWSLLESARACYDAALAHNAPFISGKDSFNNEYGDGEGRRRAIPLSLLVSAIGIVPDVRKVPGSFFKGGDSRLYVLGYFRPALGASVYAQCFAPTAVSAMVPGCDGGSHGLYQRLHGALQAGLLLSCHDLSDGGLAVALAEMAIGGERGVSLRGGAGLLAAVNAAVAPVAGGLSCPDEEHLFFGESNASFVLEVAAGRAREVEAFFSGFPCVALGSTTVAPYFCVAGQGGDDRIDLATLTAAFTSPLF